MTTAEFVNKYYPFAKAIETETGLSAIAILTQAAVESGWGTSCPQNMFFGIKAGKNWTSKKQLLRTFEYFKDDKQGYLFPEVISITWNEKKKKFLYSVRTWFRAYDTPYDCFKDHTKLFQSKYYAKAWEVRTDYERLFHAIHELGYSTSPTYADTLIGIAKAKIEPLIKQLENK